MIDVLNLYKSSVLYLKKRNTVYLKADPNAFKNIQSLAKSLDKYNLCLLLSQGYENRIWTDICSKNKGIDTFIIDETILFFKNNIYSKEAFYALIDHIAFSQCIINSDNTAIDFHIVKNMSQKESVIQTLKSNPWLLYLSLFNDCLNT